MRFDRRLLTASFPLLLLASLFVPIAGVSVATVSTQTSAVVYVQPTTTNTITYINTITNSIGVITSTTANNVATVTGTTTSTILGTTTALTSTMTTTSTSSTTSSSTQSSSSTSSTTSSSTTTSTSTTTTATVTFQPFQAHWPKYATYVPVYPQDASALAGYLNSPISGINGVIGYWATGSLGLAAQVARAHSMGIAVGQIVTLVSDQGAYNLGVSQALGSYDFMMTDDSMCSYHLSASYFAASFNDMRAGAKSINPTILVGMSDCLSQIPLAKAAGANLDFGTTQCCGTWSAFWLQVGNPSTTISDAIAAAAAGSPVWLWVGTLAQAQALAASLTQGGGGYLSPPPAPPTGGGPGSCLDLVSLALCKAQILPLNSFSQFNSYQVNFNLFGYVIALTPSIPVIISIILSVIGVYYIIDSDKRHK